MFVTSLSSLMQYDFMQNAFLAGTSIAVLAGVIGYFVVIKGLSFASHALSHISFAGACGAGLLGVSLMMGQLGLTVMAALCMAILGERWQKNDTAIGIVLAFSLGLGTLFLSFYSQYVGSVSRILFGDLLGVSLSTLWQIIYLSVFCLACVAVIARPLWFSALLPEIARMRGISMGVLHSIFFVILAVAVTVVSQAVGILLIFTLLVGPPAIAVRLTQNFWSGVLLSVLFNMLAVWLALLCAALTNWPLAFWISSIVLVAYMATHIQKN